MSIASKLAQIKEDKQDLAAKVKEFGLGDGSDSLETATDKIYGIKVYSIADSSFEVTEGKSTEFPSGYYVGGTITGLTNNELDAQKYRTQAKSCTPNKTTQVISPDNDDNGTLENGEYYALSSVTVHPIPAIYADTTDATQDVNDSIVAIGVHPDLTVYARSSDGKSAKKIKGTMHVNTASQKPLTVGDDSFTISGGFHTGNGTVYVDSEEVLMECPTNQGVEPTKVESEDGKFLSRVYIKPLSKAWANTSSATTDQNGELSGMIPQGIAVYAKNAAGVAKRIEGSMTKRRGIEASIDGILDLNTGDSINAEGSLYYTIPAGYYIEDSIISFDDSTILSLLDEI